MPSKCESLTLHVIFHAQLMRVPNSACVIQLHASLGGLVKAMERQQQQLDQLRRHITDQQEAYLEVYTWASIHKET